MFRKFSSLIPLITIMAFWTWPFLSFLSHNQDDLYLYGWSVALYCVLAITLSLIFAVVLVVFFGWTYWAQIANTLGVAGVLLFLYLPLSHLVSGLGISLGTIRISIWLALSALILFFIWRFARLAVGGAALFTVSVALLVVPTTSLTKFALYNGSEVGNKVESFSTKKEAAKLPNVYWFVFDGYARSDVLSEYFGMDNSPFIVSLEEKNFQVSKQSYANYVSTKLSISTTVNMNYYIPTGAQLHPSLWTSRIQGFNPVVQRFRKLGYRYIHAEPGGENLKTRCGGVEDECIKAKTTGRYGVNEAEVGLLRLTPLFPIIRRLLPDLISFDFLRLEDIGEHIDFNFAQPQYLFAHVLSPHPPQRYTDACAHIERVELALLGGDYADAVASYVNDLRCLNPHIIDMIDLILEKDNSDPIIVLQSDHGFRGPSLQAMVDLPAVPSEYIGFANFSAMLLPSYCDVKVGDKFSPVNTFRLVFACIDGVVPETLPNRFFKKIHGKLEEVYLEDTTRR